MTPLTAWVLTEGLVGTENQCLGLAEALDAEIVLKRLHIQAPWRWLPTASWPRPLAAARGDSLAPPYPRLVIAGGRKLAPIVAALKAQAGSALFAVFVQRPSVAARRFDLIVAPEHDGLTGGNVVTTRGAMTRITRDGLNAARVRWEPVFHSLPPPRIAVLVGGSRRRFHPGAAWFARLGEKLAHAARRDNASLMVTVSRRTGEENAAALRQALAGLPHLYFWNGEGENPYIALLAWANGVVVTSDSVSMVSEAASTGKPVHVVAVNHGSARLVQFHRSLQEAGITRPFAGTFESWNYEPLDEARRVAALVHARMAPSS